MKYLPIFCLLMVQNLFGQQIDCAQLAKINEAQTKRPSTSRTQTTTTSSLGTTSSTAEMDTDKNMRMLVKMPEMIGISANTIEMRMIKGISYSKNERDSVWYYKAIPPQDSAKIAASQKAIETGKDCKIVGTETIDGKFLTIIESSIVMSKVSDKPTVIRSWYDLKDSVIKKIEVNQVIKGGMEMKIVSELEYGVTVAPIEKPLNAVADSLRPKAKAPKRIAGAYSDKNKANTNGMPEQIAEYKEGQKTLFDFIKTNLVYPQSAREAKLEGTVYARFSVETDGKITDISILRGIGSGCDEAAIEVIKKMAGNWNCALDGGKPVRSQFTLPIQFRLNNISVKD